jgi:hypothetical protein
VRCLPAGQHRGPVAYRRGRMQTECEGGPRACSSPLVAGDSRFSQARVGQSPSTVRGNLEQVRHLGAVRPPKKRLDPQLGARRLPPADPTPR